MYTKEDLKLLAKHVQDICRDPNIKSFKQSLNNAKRNKGGMNSNNRESQAAIVGKIFIKEKYSTMYEIPLSRYLKNAICVYSKPQGDTKKNTKEINDKIDILKQRSVML